MDENYNLTAIARIKSEFPTKFGVPRQSGLTDALRAEIIFEPPYRNPDALRGLDGFSHIWLVWVFHQSIRRSVRRDTGNQSWSPTVRPPRLGGNTRMGVFATRSPFRPNPIGLSCVRLEAVENRPDSGPVLIVRGADLVNDTPILDIKPYLPYADCVPDAVGGFAAQPPSGEIPRVDIPPDLLSRVPEAYQAALYGVLSQDPRPRYHNDPERVYGFTFAGMEIRFTVHENHLTVREIIKNP